MKPVRRHDCGVYSGPADQLTSSGVSSWHLGSGEKGAENIVWTDRNHGL